MVKKHREKRQKYVELLRAKEKEREAYLEKRNRKRSRDEDEGEDQATATSSRVDDNTAELKKRRVDPSVVVPAPIVSDEASTLEAKEATPASTKPKSQSKKKY